MLGSCGKVTKPKGSPLKQQAFDHSRAVTRRGSSLQNPALTHSLTHDFFSPRKEEVCSVLILVYEVS